MNDAQPPRRNAADGHDRDQHPDDPYAGSPYAYGQDPYQQGDHYPAGDYQQDGGQGDPYAQGGYGGAYPQQPESGYPQDAYGYGQYPAERRGYADPYGDTGAQQPPIPQQQAYQDPYGTGRYDTGQYDAGQYGATSYDTGQYDTGQWNTAQGYATGTGQYPAHPQGQHGEHGTQAGQAQQVRQDAASQYAPPAAAAAAAARTAAPAPPRRAPAENPYAELGELDRDQDGPQDDQRESGPGGRSTDYRTEQFSFVDDEEEDAEVIDWLKFAETRTERRDERKRKGRNRRVALVVVLVLALVGGVGYLWQQGKLPFLPADEKASAPAAAQRRDVIVVHLRELDREDSSTALLVSNETTGKGTTVLLPNSLAISTDDADSTTLGKSVDTAGAGPTRDSLSALLGADIKGTWRLDTPFLELLVESLGGINLDTDTQVKGTGKQKAKTLVKKGENQRLGGVGAVAYATHRGPGEAIDKQLARFGQVMEAVLKKMPSGSREAARTIRSLGAVPDPSLPENELGASLAPLAEQAKTGKFQTLTLPVQPDGTLDEDTTKRVVKDVLGGTVKNTDPSATPSVRVQNATGRDDAVEGARISLVNSGYTVVPGGRAKAVAATSRVSYTDAADAQLAKEVAQTLGLPKSAVKKASGGAQSTRITVVLGQNFTG